MKGLASLTVREFLCSMVLRFCSGSSVLLSMISSSPRVHFSLIMNSYAILASKVVVVSDANSMLSIGSSHLIMSSVLWMLV